MTLVPKLRANLAAGHAAQAFLPPQGLMQGQCWCLDEGHSPLRIVRMQNFTLMLAWASAKPLWAP